MALVLDASIAAAWCFPDETSTYADLVLARLHGTHAMVPAIWSLEIANVLVMGERRRRIEPAHTTRFIELLRSAPIVVDTETPDRALGVILALARERRLTAYDAAYLELAMRLGLPLATLDERLRGAAAAAGVPLVE